VSDTGDELLRIAAAAERAIGQGLDELGAALLGLSPAQMRRNIRAQALGFPNYYRLRLARTMAPRTVARRESALRRFLEGKPTRRASAAELRRAGERRTEANRERGRKGAVTRRRRQLARQYPRPTSPRPYHETPHSVSIRTRSEATAYRWLRWGASVGRYVVIVGHFRFVRRYPAKGHEAGRLLILGGRDKDETARAVLDAAGAYLFAYLTRRAHAGQAREIAGLEHVEITLYEPEP